MAGVRGRFKDISSRSRRTGARRLYLAIFVFFGIGIAIVGRIEYQIRRASAVREALRKIESVADRKADLIVFWLRDTANALEATAAAPFFAREVQTFVARPDAPEVQEDLTTWLSSLVAHHQDWSITLLDAHQREILAYPPGSREAEPATRELAAEAFRQRRVLLSDLHEHETWGSAHFHYVVPVFAPIPPRPGKWVEADPLPAVGEPLATVEVQVEARGFLFPTLRDWPYPSRTGEILLVRRDGDSVVFLNELRHRPGSAPGLRLPIETPDLVAAAAVRNQIGVLEGVDYRGEPVFAATRPLPGTPWFLVAKIDRAEVLLPLSRQGWAIGGTVLLRILVMGLAVALLWRREESQRLQRELAAAQRIRFLTEYAHDIILLTDPKWRILEANDRAAEAFGLSIDELRATTLPDLMIPESGAELEHRTTGWENSGPVLFRITHQRKDGSTFPAHLNLQTLTVDGQRLFQAIIRDLSEKAQREREIQESRARYVTVARNLPRGVVLFLDRELRILLTVGEELGRLGFSEEEFVGRSIRDLIPPMEIQAVDAQHLRILAGESLSFTKEFAGQRFLVRVAPLHDATGNVHQILALAVNVTEIERVQEELRVSEKQFRLLFEHAALGMIQVDRDGRILRVNAKFCEIVGRDVDELVGSFMRDFTPPEEWEERLAFVRQLAGSAAETRSVEARYTRPDGSQVWGNVTITVVREPSGAPSCFIGIVEDITARKLAEERLRELHADLENRVRARTAELEAANRELEAFSASVSHDLRAPLRAIGGFTEAVLEDCGEQLTAQGRDYLGRVRKAVTRMTLLIDDLLGLSRVGRQELKPEPVDLSALVARLIGDLKAAQPDRAVEFTVQDGVLSRADPTLIEVALGNLLQNAWKFTAGRAPARIEFGARNSGPGTVFFVRDNGVGFDMEHADRLFEPFQRLHADAEYPGMGVGLATVRRIIARHGGEVWAHGEVNRGATFYFTIGTPRPEQDRPQRSPDGTRWVT